ncbi:MAG TPA: DegQ family serine endoprotease, partial [Gammaproteobacteria bacterium]|nr:DegQ family serine endoprotease [Gammaproteobacteria bacterium]
AVVNIMVTKVEQSSAVSPEPFNGSPLEQFFGRYFEYRQQPRRMEGQGSGFVIDPSGYIVTNNHVISHADHIVVTFQDGEKLNAKLVGHDPKTDLALIKVDASHKLPSVSFGDSDKARIGDWVLAIGNPFGLGGTATAGIISARGRNIEHGPYDDYLQIDAPINPGNSGGPVLNAKGQVIGINTAIYSPNGGNVGIGFAIPSNQAASVIAQLKNGGEVERGWLGVQIQSIDEDLAKSLGLGQTEGALVADVMSGSPAAQAGFETGDVVTRFGTAKIDSARTLSRVVGEHRPGDSVKVDVLREGKPLELNVRLGDASSPDAVAANPGDAEDGGQSLGLTLAPLTDDNRAQLGLPDGVRGVLVVDVDPDGPAADKGIQPGDVITQVNHHPVTSVGAAMAEFDHAKRAGANALLLVRRGDSQHFVAMSLS